MKLSIVELFLLLAQHPSKGRFVIGDMQINYCIIGAILLEMSLDGMIGLENDVLVLKDSSEGNIDTSANRDAAAGTGTIKQIVSEISAIISSSKKPRKIRYWIGKLVQKSNKYKWAFMSELESRSLIRIESKKFLGIIPYKSSYLTDTKARDIVIEQLKNNMLLNQDLSNESVVMLGLVEASKMYSVFSKDRGELKIIKANLKQIIKESPIANSLDQTIKQVQAAILGAVIAGSMAASAGRGR